MGSMKDHFFGDAVYPHRPGFKVGGTSQVAAQTISPRARTLRDRVLDAIRSGPMTADEVAEYVNETVLATRPRLSELHKMGKIEKTGERRRNVSGASAEVWRIVE